MAGIDLAEPGTRIIARIIDSIIGLFLLAVVVGWIFVAFGIDDGDRGGSAAAFDWSVVDWGFTIVVVVVGFVWEAGFVHLMGGTPGKLVMGIRIANLDDQSTPPGLGVAAKRSANRLLGLIPVWGVVVAPVVIAIISLVYLFQDDRRTVMDRFGGTVVIKKP